MAIFDRPNSDIVYAADFLRFTPKEIMGLAYGVNPEEFAQAVAPIRQSVVLGPPVESRNRENVPGVSQGSFYEGDDARSYPGLQPGYGQEQRPSGPEMPHPWRMEPKPVLVVNYRGGGCAPLFFCSSKMLTMIGVLPLPG